MTKKRKLKISENNFFRRINLVQFIALVYDVSYFTREFKKYDLFFEKNSPPVFFHYD